ncbi:bifunctional adenosylcobinamide kinase/adenosylcobinamide-phosphate guanylyltransferase [Chloroflexota bacterium]
MDGDKLGSTLIIGGVRSGKSNYAQKLAIGLSQPVLFVATGEAGDEEMRLRIEEHKKIRPASWRTLEVTTNVGQRIGEGLGTAQTVIVDCITLLVSNVVNKHLDSRGELSDIHLIEEKVMMEIRGLIDCINRDKAHFIIVTNEVGSGLMPINRVGRLYCDLLGSANQILAQWADVVLMMVAGLALRIKST